MSASLLGSIYFFSEDISFSLHQGRKWRHWIKEIIQSENKICQEINYIFCSDRYLLEINQKFLNHSTYTDIITFDHSEEKKKLSGDIFISIERIRENATSLNVPFEKELARVIAHGILHLCGYKDKTPKEKTLMREKEDFYLILKN